MPQTLQEYADWLEGRNLIWPAPPPAVPARATPYLKPLKGIRAVTWSVYGTLLRIADGELLFDPPQTLRMQIAMEKTIDEFNMWHSMHRKPGPPWEQLYAQYKRFLEQQTMAGTKQKGDVPEVNSAVIWRKLIGQLQQKDYRYDVAFYGDEDQLAEKVAYFFHASLQGTEAAPDALSTLTRISGAGLRQGLLADAQPFTFVQMLRAFKRQGRLPPPGELFAPQCLTLSYQEGVRKPSKSLYRACRGRFASLGIGPREVLHIGSRLRDDLAAAREAGFRTALYAADKVSLQARGTEVKDRNLRPDRLLTDLSQVRDLLSIP